MRISGGVFKSRQLSVPSGSRPVSFRVRKSCFDIVGDQIPGRKVLDLFSGSGALGIEAISRGAREAVFVEAKAASLAVIRRNIISLGLGSVSRLIRKDSFLAIAHFFKRKEYFDLLFLDPPYYKGMLRKALQALEEYDIVAPSGYIIGFCYLKDDFLKKSEKFSLISRRNYGQTSLLIYRR
jgi:16S rRNA (guanine966-N2)-methyltransferase